MLRQLTASDAVFLSNQKTKVLPDATPDASRYCILCGGKTSGGHSLRASWDAKYRAITRGSMSDAQQALAERVNFGEVDCDNDPDLAKSIPILNVPSVSYYRDGKLVGAVVGAGQDVRLHLERVLRGDPIR